MPTIKEVAARAGVSVGTVSNVLSGVPTVQRDLRARVQRAIKVLGYRPNLIARSLKQQRTNTLGIVVSDITNPFFPELIRGAEETALAKGFLLLTCNTDDQLEREKQILDMLEQRRIDGLLLVPAIRKSSNAHIARFVQSGIPVVCLDRAPEGIDVDSVTVDNEGGAKACVAHLISRGHRRIAILAGRRTMYITSERLAGYKTALAEAGIGFDKQLVLEGDFHRRSAYLLSRSVLSTPDRPTAVFSSNFLMTEGLLQAAEELRLKIPRDLSVATFDEPEIADVFHPRLTAVSQPARRIGEEGTRLLLERIENKERRPARHIVLPTELHILESTR
jgi:LacI family transcriptional regulator